MTTSKSKKAPTKTPAKGKASAVILFIAVPLLGLGLIGCLVMDWIKLAILVGTTLSVIVSLSTRQRFDKAQFAERLSNGLKAYLKTYGYLRKSVAHFDPDGAQLLADDLYASKADSALGARALHIERDMITVLGHQATNPEVLKRMIAKLKTELDGDTPEVQVARKAFQEAREARLPENPTEGKLNSEIRAYVKSTVPPEASRKVKRAAEDEYEDSRPALVVEREQLFAEAKAAYDDAKAYAEPRDKEEKEAELADLEAELLEAEADAAALANAMDMLGPDPSASLTAAPGQSPWAGGNTMMGGMGLAAGSNSASGPPPLPASTAVVVDDDDIEDDEDDPLAHLPSSPSSSPPPPAKKQRFIPTAKPSTRPPAGS